MVCGGRRVWILFVDEWFGWGFLGVIVILNI